MKIIIFTYSVTRTAGGVLDAVRDMFTNRNFVGHKLNVLSFKGKYTEEDMPSWQGISMQLFKAWPMLYSREAKKALLAADADILHMETLWRYPQLLMSAWKKRRKEPIVCTPHGMLDPYIIRNQGWIKRIVARLFFQKSLEAADCYHALCTKEMEDIREYGLKQPVAIIPNGINLPSPDMNFEKTDSRKHILYLGRLHRKKGVDMLLIAASTIMVQNPELLRGWQIDLVGWDHENCRAELEHIVKDNGLEDIVVFHGGMFGNDKMRMYACADGYILPSHGEGLPMTVLEAWSWKKPAIITPECHLPEGYEAEAAIRIEDNVKSVTDGLIRFLTMTEEEREKMGQNGYNLVCSSFTWDAAARKMIELYEWLSGKRKKPDFVYESCQSNRHGNVYFRKVT